MDLSILQKISEMLQQGLSVGEIKEQLRAGGLAPESVNEALVEAGAPAVAEQQPQEQMFLNHHEKVIMPEPGFNPDAPDA